MQADGRYWCGGELDPHPSHPQPTGPSEESSWVRWGERKALPKVNISMSKWAPPSSLFLLPLPTLYPRVNPLGLGKVLDTLLRLCVASKPQMGLFSSLLSGSGTAKPGTIQKLSPGPLHASYRMIHHSLQIKGLMGHGGVLEPDRLGPHASPSPDVLRGPGQVTHPLWASVDFPVKSAYDAA